MLSVKTYIHFELLLIYNDKYRIRDLYRVRESRIGFRGQKKDPLSRKCKSLFIVLH